MKLLLPAALSAGLLLAFTACSSGPQIPPAGSSPTPSSVKATALLKASQQAHGAASFSRLRDISVAYEGNWGPVGPKFQPVLADTRYRGTSEERLLPTAGILAQHHSGPAGKKHVLRQKDGVQVTYNGTPDDSAKVNDAAALVADAYRLFLLGPLAVDPQAPIQLLGTEIVDGAVCDRVLTVFKPGFGKAPEDRVILSLDQRTHILRRVRLTLNGLESTQGAEVDVTFNSHRRIAGVLWATDYVERIRVPFDLLAHEWRLTGLDVNRGMQAGELAAPTFTGRAAAPAKPIP